jgi:CPA1 family monovalent cation:H+ antiporter
LVLGFHFSGANAFFVGAGWIARSSPVPLVRFEPVMSILELIAVLVSLAALFAFINIHYLKLPSTIGLMALALGLSGTLIGISLGVPELLETTRAILRDYDFSEVLLDVMLSFLLFAGALEVNLRKLRQEKWTILILATAGVLLSTVLIGTITYGVLPLLGLEVGYVYCLLFGSLISPTDPIAVLAMIQKSDTNISQGMETKIAGESLFNDGVGVVIFLTILSVAQQGVGAVSVAGVLGLFAQEAIGGILFGAVLGYAGFWVLRYIDNEHVELEVLVTLAMVLAGTQVAHDLHVSAPLTMVVMGIFVGRSGRPAHLAEVAGSYVHKFWHIVDEALNAILFLLIGLEVLIIPWTLDYVIFGLLAIAITLLGRFSGVGVPISIMRLLRSFERGTIRILTWGGLRGGISVALALSLPDVPVKDLFVTATYSVVVFSVIVQGLTVSPLFEMMVGGDEAAPRPQTAS